MSADFVYGNTRLRARFPALLGRSELERLLTLDADALLGELARTAYAPEVEAESVRGTPAEAVHRASTRHLGRALRELRAFYEGKAGEVVDVLLGRWDLHNLLALLRAQAAGDSEKAATAALVPLGGLDAAAAAEVARQHEPAAAIERLVAWRLPTPGLARALDAAWSAYERDEDLPRLEAQLAATAARTALARAGSLGAAAGPVLDALRRELDVRNVMTVLRLVAGAPDAAAALGEQLAPGSRSAHAPLAEGGIRIGALVDASRAQDSADAARILAGDPAAAPWRDALEGFVHGDADLVRLERELEAAALVAARRQLRRGDPLGAAVPTAFVLLKEAEARNVRVVAEGASGGDVETLAEDLVLV